MTKQEQLDRIAAREDYVKHKIQRTSSQNQIANYKVIYWFGDETTAKVASFILIVTDEGLGAEHATWATEQGDPFFYLNPQPSQFAIAVKNKIAADVSSITKVLTYSGLSINEEYRQATFTVWWKETASSTPEQKNVLIYDDNGTLKYEFV